MSESSPPSDASPNASATSDSMSFEEMATSRREWIDQVLRPWCEAAKQSDLVRAELDWTNLAGEIDPNATLYHWAFGRFPDLIHEGLAGVNETHEVEVTTNSGETFRGFPDQSATRHAKLVLLLSDGTARLTDPISIDDIASVRRVTP